MKAVILAAGQGTRLRPVTLTMPKPLVPVANKALIEYAIDILKDSGYGPIGIIVNDLDSPICKQLNNGKKLGVELEYIVQAEQLGLAHAVNLAKPFVGDEPFCVFLGDNVFQDKMETLLTTFEHSEAEAAVALGEVSDPGRFGIAALSEDRQWIVKVIEKPKDAPSNLAISGVYLFRKSIFDAISQIKPSWRNELEITDAIGWLIDQGKKVRPYTMKGWWIDAGKPDAIIQANQLVLGELPYSPPPEDPLQIRGNSEVSHRVILGKGSSPPQPLGPVLCAAGTFTGTPLLV